MSLHQLLHDNDFNLDVLDDVICLYTLHPRQKQAVLGYLLPILLSDDFFRITQSTDEVSLMVSNKYQHEMSRLCNLSSMPDSYQALRVYQTSHGINELGVVSKLAKFFSDSGISILYVNSFNNNFILVPTSDMSRLVEVDYIV